MPKPEWVTAQLLVSVVTILIVMHILLGLAALGIYLERKISAFMQDRLGPNRVGFGFGLPIVEKLTFGWGFWGLGQVLADGIKMLVKEDHMPKGADKVLFRMAPGLAVVPALIGWAIVPWGGTLHIPGFTIPILGWPIDAADVQVAGANISIGIVYLIAASSLSIYAVALGSWASNNKFSFLGGLRASSQMISYEIPLGLSILVVLMTAGSLLPSRMVEHQLTHGWMLFSQPLVAAIFFICTLAECNRAPFDNAECEAELVGGYHTEFSSMSFGLFFLGEYIHMFVGSAMFAVLFLGGWQILPWVDLPGLNPQDTGILAVLFKFAILFGKAFTIYCFMIVIRWTLPRLRFDQVMQVAWQAVIPVSLVLVVANAVVMFYGYANLLTLLGVNIAVAVIALAVQPLLPRSTSSRKIPMAGSRFSPLPEERVFTQTTDRLAREDRPVESLAGMNL